MLRQIVAWIEPRDLARPEDMEFGRNRAWLIQRHDAEVGRVRLVIDLDMERCAALLAERPLPEAARSNDFDRVFARRRDPIAAPDARECHRRGAAIELAGAAMAPAGIERVAVELEPYAPAHASAGQSHGSPFN